MFWSPRLFYFGFFFSLVWISFLSLSSVFAFFHFQLGHDLGTIDEWFVGQGWAIIFFCKILAFAIVLSFLKLKTNLSLTFNQVLKRGQQHFTKEMQMAYFMLVFLTIAVTRPEFKGMQTFALSKMLVAIFGGMVFYFSDIFLFYVLVLLYPFNNRVQKNKAIILYAFLSYFLNKSIFLFSYHMNFMTLINFLALYFLVFDRKENWASPFQFILFFLIPMMFIFGLDPVWKTEFSILKIGHSFSLLEYFVMLSFAILFIEMRRRKWHWAMALFWRRKSWKVS
jgi:hypothetical protein